MGASYLYSSDKRPDRPGEGYRNLIVAEIAIVRRVYVPRHSRSETKRAGRAPERAFFLGAGLNPPGSIVVLAFRGRRARIAVGSCEFQ